MRHKRVKTHRLGKSAYIRTAQRANIVQPVDERCESGCESKREEDVGVEE